MKNIDVLSTIEKLCFEHGKLNTIVESSYDAIFEIDKDGFFLYANPALASLFEIKYSECKKYNLFDLLNSTEVMGLCFDLFNGKKNIIKLNLEIPVNKISVKYIELKMVGFSSVNEYHVFGIILDKTDVIRAIKNREYFIDKLYKLIKEIKIETKDAIYYLAKLVEIHDHSTGKHIERIEHYTRALASEYYRKYGETDKYITEDYIEDLAVSSVLHDIGKVAVSDTILLKPGKLTKDEFEVIKQHTEIVGEALKSFKGKKDFLALGREIAIAHHEKWDGTGYPKGLKGEEIPLSARIISLCDVYDALVSNRPYKMAINHEEAIKIIKKEKGKSFDPVLTEIFININEEIDKIRKKFDSD